MQKKEWSKVVRQAHFDALDTTGIMPDTEKEEYLHAFAARWGDFSVEAFKRVLQHGDAEDRLFALFALGYLAPPEGDILLPPFLDSPIRKERWASAISLGRLKNERVFSLLQELLMEEVEYCLPSLTAVSGSDDPLLKKAWEKEYHDEDTEYVREYEWCLLHRFHISRLLGSWGNPHAIPVLVQAFQRSLELEFRSTYPNNFHIFAQEWHYFQDCLTYALGALGAWNVLDTLNVPPKRLHIARRYLVFGSLHANVPQVFNFCYLHCYLTYWGKNENAIRSLLAWPGGDLTLGLPDLERVDQMLRERFYPCQKGQLPSFHDFLKWHDERNDEWRNRWDAERNQTNEAEQSDDLFLPEENSSYPLRLQAAPQRGKDRTVTRFFIGEETKRLLVRVARTMAEHYDLQTGEALPTGAYSPNYSRKYRFEAAPYLLQYNHQALPGEAITACMRFFLHGMIFRTRDAKPVVLKAHLLRHAFAFGDHSFSGADTLSF